VKRPVRPANTALPASCDAAPVAAGEDDDSVSEVEVPFVMFPPVPAVVVGETFSSACAAAFLKAANVLGPDCLKGSLASHRKVCDSG
jgi:hypothetical protein